jgi:hypothetical protein
MPGRPFVLAALLATPLAAAPEALRVKASPAVAPCVAATAAEYERATGRRVAVDAAPIASPDSAQGADLVVAADDELPRVIESGASHPDLDVDVARIPWVLAGPPGTAAPEARTLRRNGGVVRTLDGVAAREAWRNLALQGLVPDRVERAARGPIVPGQGELAVVPLSVAGPGPVSVLDVPPLTARAVGVRASTRPGAARDFLDFLVGEKGNAAFRACGRGESR